MEMPTNTQLKLYWREGMTKTEYVQAKAARGEMLRNLSSRPLPKNAERKTWAQRMNEKHPGKYFN